MVDANGKVPSGNGTPTKEFRFHLGIYRTREDVDGIVHCHAPFATAFASKGIPIPAYTIHAKRSFPDYAGGAGTADGSEELADQVVGAFWDPEVNLILLAAHGLLPSEKPWRMRRLWRRLAEETAKIALSVRLLDLP